MNSGQFIYTLDDPYIHLRLAENILKGHYGINISEYSAPSSSILWPLLLAPFSASSIGQYAPLLLNLGATLGTLLIMGSHVNKIFNSDVQAGILVSLLVPGLNLIGMTFTGMEHSLQIFLAIMVASGLIVELETGQAKWWLILALIVGPLVRYEALSLTIASSAYLIYRRHHKVAGFCLLISIIFIGAFSWFLSSLNLGLLPSSVIAKSQAINSDGILPGLVLTFMKNLLTRQGTILLAGLLLFGFFFLQAQRRSKEKGLAVWAMSILLIHLSIIPVGGNRFYRYDLYIFAITILLLLYLYGSSINRISASFSRISRAFLAITILATISFPFLGHAFLTPLASNNIYEQQYQMKLFFQKYYREPVAVNDLGLVSYGAHNYVLDLWGLGSHEALNERRNNHSGEWMDRLARKYNVHLAMIYERWFPTIPENWIRLGTLHLGKATIAPADAKVTFYAIDQENIITTRLALQSFKQSLPAGVGLEIESDQRNVNVHTHPSSF